MFDAADDGGAVLLFDEADALFGKRSEVKDAHDRYANIQVNYLLQRLEAFSGAGDPDHQPRKQHGHRFDAAAAIRVALPRSAGPRARAAVAAGVSGGGGCGGAGLWRVGAGHAGRGSIRNVAVNALYLAVSRGEALGMDLMREALQLEFRKTGRLNLGSGSSSGTQGGASELGIRGQA